MTFEPDPYAAAAGAFAVAILTEWPCYAELDYQAIYDRMVKPAFLFDGRNLVDHHALHRMGFNVYPMGKPALVHFPDTSTPGRNEMRLTAYPKTSEVSKTSEVCVVLG